MFSAPDMRILKWHAALTPGRQGAIDTALCPVCVAASTERLPLSALGASQKTSERPQPTRPDSMSKNQLRAALSKLMESAFDFLEKSVDELDKHPKYSVIHFATAIELLLKSRLMREHWILVVDRASDAVLEDFIAGKSRTVSQSDAIKRLSNACGETIGKDAVAQFARIAAHRNRMIHFYHEAGAEQADRALIEEVVKEQCLCWFHLERLLSEWGDQFRPYEPNIGRVRRKMLRNRDYLSVAFDRIDPQIEVDRRAGTPFRHCGGCGYCSAAVQGVSDVLFQQHCRVCGLGEAYLEFPCPAECGETLHIEADGASERDCPNCGCEISATVLSDVLDTEHADPTDYHTPMNCALCSSLGSVVKHHEKYICTECLEMSDEICGCEWCNELQMGGGDLEFSYHSGCEFCDGHSGWMRDD